MSKVGEFFKSLGKATAAIIVIMAIIGLSYLITAGVLWIICKCIGWTWWSWKNCLGVWLVLSMLTGTSATARRK